MLSFAAFLRIDAATMVEMDKRKLARHKQERAAEDEEDEEDEFDAAADALQYIDDIAEATSMAVQGAINKLPYGELLPIESLFILPFALFAFGDLVSHFASNSNCGHDCGAVGPVRGGGAWLQPTHQNTVRNSLYILFICLLRIIYKKKLGGLYQLNTMHCLCTSFIFAYSI